MAERKNEVGNRYGKLLVLEYAGTNGHNALWKCKCDCGKECVKLGVSLRCGHTRSCGCYHKEQLSERNTKYKVCAPRRLYQTWRGMIDRCENPKAKYYCNYGGRGISVCTEWHEFETFAKWALNNGYTKELTIDRMDNDGSYCPENCKWSTKIEQENNKRSNRKVTINGETKNLCQWCELYGIKEVSVYSRMRYGWDIEKAIKTPVRPSKKIVCIETGEVFETARLAGNKYGVSKTSISECCLGKAKTSAKLHWKYLKEEQPIENENHA